MATIQDLLQLDLSKVRPQALQDSVKGIIKDYNDIEAKQVFEKEEEASINKIYQMVTKVSPDAIADNPCVDPQEEKPKKKPTEKKKKTTTKKKAKKETPQKITIKKELDEVLNEIKQCRVKIRKYNEQKRKEEGPKPQPTRYAKIKGHIISLGNLIPKGLKEDLEVQKEANRLLRSTHRSLLKIYKMTSVKGEKDSKELKERYEKIEEKLEK
ncbi:hypothetical protein HN014_04365 [Aquimarina sp. TRL1]|uniref:hypothetical protein n=1 Tax=Aquimarina sp. (strain TRL1) TaxID=2736252 RepID=UPI00158BE6C1|nr:hypothetical protein [Aquimarina sp. TRL1]QKX04172.1 hypothetical protein HN014_04365 [Aquimarina sp. TRL1]